MMNDDDIRTSDFYILSFQFKIDLNRTLPPLKKEDAEKIENLYKTVPVVKSQRHPVTPPKQRKINGMLWDQKLDTKTQHGAPCWDQTQDLLVRSPMVYHQALVLPLTHLSLASFLWDIGKQHSPRCGVPSGLFCLHREISSKNEIKK